MTNNNSGFSIWNSFLDDWFHYSGDLMFEEVEVSTWNHLPLNVFSFHPSDAPVCPNLEPFGLGTFENWSHLNDYLCERARELGSAELPNLLLYPAGASLDVICGAMNAVCAMADELAH